MNAKSMKFCLVFPTNNQYKRIGYWISSKLNELVRYDIDVVVFDNMRNGEETKNLIENCFYKNIYYDYYDEISKYPTTIDEKVKFILKKTSEKYDVIWVCRDRSFPNISAVYDLILESYNSGNDFVIINPHPVLECTIETYKDAAELAKYEYGEMTSLGAIVFFKKIAEDISDNVPVIENINLGLWLPTALFQCIANKNFMATKICANSFYYFPYTEPSHWLKNRSAVTLFTKWFPNIIKNLPKVYADVREDILTMRYWSMPLYNSYFLTYCRASGNFSFLDIIENFNILLKQTRFKILKLFFYSLMPRVLMYRCLQKQIFLKDLPKMFVQKIKKKLNVIKEG